MKTNYWVKKWQSMDIGFHEHKPNPLMTDNFSALQLLKGNRVFVPMCGKTRDIAWLLTQGYRVAGAELIESAIIQLFDELKLEAEISELGDFIRYSAKDIDIYVGDIFKLSRRVLGDVNAIYDRAAIVALPYKMRRRYTSQLIEISQHAPQLLISFEYDQTQMDGPPFSVTSQELAEHYAANYELRLIGSKAVPGGLKGKCEATENVWLLRTS